MADVREEWTVPDQVAANSRRSAEGRAWLDGLHDLVTDLTRRWSLEIEGVFDAPDVTASWVAPVRLARRARVERSRE